MAVAFRSSDDVTNGTAGTSVTVPAPAGIVDTGDNPDRDHLIALIAAAGAPTITPPAGWTLIDTVASGTDVTMWAYRKLADSEGADWTWTLGSSLRNWGVVLAYTGVDPTSPVYNTSEVSSLTSSTTIYNGDAVTAAGGYIAAAAATRTASGSATTWTVVDDDALTVGERADLSTNEGAGTDISGVVGDVAWPQFYATILAVLSTASQTQTAGVSQMVMLRPYFVPYTGAVNATGIVVEAALDVDPDSDSTDWTWTALSVLEATKVYLRHGRSNRSGTADPSEMRVTVKNLTGEFTLPGGAYFGKLVLNLPLRVRLNGFGTAVGGVGYHRGTFFLASARPRWDVSTNFSVIDIVAAGRLRRLQRRDEPLKSAAYTAIQRMYSFVDPTTPARAHWPLEDAAGSTSAASAVAGASAAAVSGMTFAADSTCVGSAPLVTLDAAATLFATVPDYADTGTWTVMFVATVPTEPGADTGILGWNTTGTASLWRVTLTPGSPSALHLRAYNAAGTQILDASSSLTEADFYGAALFYTITATQNGTGIDYSIVAYSIGVGGGATGTLASNTCGRVTSFGINPPTLSGSSIGHIAVHVQPGAEGLFASTAVLEGGVGDWPWERFGRLCDEQNIRKTFDQPDTFDLTMGPQSIASFMSLVRECETVEGSVLNDSGTTGGETGVLWFPARDDRENIDAQLTLDMAQSQVQPGFQPILDDQDIVNDVEVSRTDGSSARVENAASIARGRVREAVTVNTENDLYLADLAGWRVNLGTVEGMRFPSVTWNLRHSPTLAEDWVNMLLFQRLDILNPPSQYPPDDIRTILEGYTETISSTTWEVTANLSPFLPNHVAVLAEPLGDTGTWLGRAVGDDDACALRTAIDSDDLPIAFDPNRQRWTTRLVWDAFGRTSVDEWGTADSGQTWVNTGGAASAYSVSGGVGSVAISAVNSSRWCTITSPSADVRIVGSVATDVLATGGSHFMQLAARWADANNTYLARLDFTTAQATNLTIRKRVAGTETLLSSTIATGITHAAGTYVSVALEVQGSTLRAKAWLTTDDPPVDWAATVTDTALTAAGSVGMRNILSSANSNALPVTSTWDNFAVSEPGDDADDFPLNIRLGGEVVTVSGNATTPATFVAAGAASHADNASVTPALYAGAAAGDLILVVGAIRSSGTGILSPPTGYTRLPVFALTDHMQIWAKVHSGSESDPTVEQSSSGSAGDTVSAFTIGFRNTPTTLDDLADIVVDSLTMLNASAADIAYPGTYPRRVPGCIALLVAWKQDDYTSIAVPSGWTEILEASTTTGSDQSLYAAYQIQTAAAATVPGSLVVTGGASAISRSAAVSLAGGYQTFTASARAVNGATSSHAVGTTIAVEDPGVTGM